MRPEKAEDENEKWSLSSRKAACAMEKFLRLSKINWKRKSNQWTNQSSNQTINQTINQSGNQWISQSVDRSINQSITQSIIQWSNQQSVNLTIRQSITLPICILPTTSHFYTNVYPCNKAVKQAGQFIFADPSWGMTSQILKPQKSWKTATFRCLEISEPNTLPETNSN